MWCKLTSLLTETGFDMNNIGILETIATGISEYLQIQRDHLEVLREANTINRELIVTVSESAKRLEELAQPKKRAPRKKVVAPETKLVAPETKLVEYNSKLASEGLHNLICKQIVTRELVVSVKDSLNISRISDIPTVEEWNKFVLSICENSSNSGNNSVEEIKSVLLQ